MVLSVAVAVVLVAAIVPVVRATMPAQVSFNEGWNVYNAEIFARGGLLYPAKFGWTAMVYPMLSFVIFAKLHRVTHDFLFTARAVSVASLMVTAAFAGATVRLLGARRRVALLAGLFCFGVFCADGERYVGMDDPQLLAQSFMVAALWIYIRYRSRPLPLVVTALIFVVGLFIKHNPVDFPSAVLLDLLLTSVSATLLFSTALTVFAVAGVLLSYHFGGPSFLAQVLSPKMYSLLNLELQLKDVLGPMLLPLLAAGVLAWRQRHLRDRRIVGLLLLTSVVLGTLFAGGRGVSINALFSALLAVCVCMGLVFEEVAAREHGPVPWNALVPATAFVWLLIPMQLAGELNPVGRVRELRRAQTLWTREVAALRAQPGPALCESMLACYEAGKPYVYDPYNATRLIALHRLDEGWLLRQLSSHQIQMIQTNGSLAEGDRVQHERFAPDIRRAIQASYVPIELNRESDRAHLPSEERPVVYVPRAEPGEAHEPAGVPPPWLQPSGERR